jgi:hypothetical protein
MSARQHAAQQVTAMQIVNALRSYERHIGQLSCGRMDMDVYQATSLEIDQIRAWCGTLPQTSVPWIALLISHADLVYFLWHSTRPDGLPPDGVEQRLREHRALIDALAQRCEHVGDEADSPLRPAWG